MIAYNGNNNNTGSDVLCAQNMRPLPKLVLPTAAAAAYRRYVQKRETDEIFTENKNRWHGVVSTRKSIRTIRSFSDFTRSRV